MKIPRVGRALILLRSLVRRRSAQSAFTLRPLGELELVLGEEFFQALKDRLLRLRESPLRVTLAHGIGNGCRRLGFAKHRDAPAQLGFLVVSWIARAL